ncbi:unnamed protein product [Peniophora sp. CBMAI 1063]|nr:unnamed protein product [Peniophora sp. CBMAI 1063]
MLSPRALSDLDLPVPAPFPPRSIPLPGPPRSALADDDHMSVYNEDDEALATTRIPPLPPAPMLKDLDSFSQGSAIGSFDAMDYVQPGQAEDSYQYDNGYTTYTYPGPVDPVDVERWRIGVMQVDLHGRRPLPTPPPESGDRAAKRRRVSELPRAHDHRQFIVAPAARQGSLQPDVERQAQALKIELKARQPALVRAASAPPVLGR